MNFYSLPDTVTWSLISPRVKKGYKRGWGSEQQATSEKIRILVKQSKTLGISQTELPFALDVSVTPEGMGWALWQR